MCILVPRLTCGRAIELGIGDIMFGVRRDRFVLGRAAFVVALALVGEKVLAQSPASASQGTTTAAVQPPPAAVDDRWRVPPRPAAELAVAAPLEALNKEFRQTYQVEQDVVKGAFRTLIIVRLSGATLFRNGQIVETRRVIPSTYHNLRYTSHAAFTVYLKLSRFTDRKLDSTVMADVQRYHALVRAARPALVNLGLTAIQAQRQQQIFARLDAFLSEAEHRAFVSRDDLRAFARGISLLIEQNTFDAGVAQVEGLHEQVREWRRQVADADWRDLHVVIAGGQQARAGAVATQYFAQLLQDDGDHRGYVGESRRLVYREEMAASASPPWDPHLALASAIDMDADASEAFFSDPDRLSVEVMADGAKARIRSVDFTEVRIGDTR
jgi:hypothetical protein